MIRVVDLAMVALIVVALFVILWLTTGIWIDRLMAAVRQRLELENEDGDEPIDGHVGREKRR